MSSSVENRACCACLTVVYAPWKHLASGMTVDQWGCENCGAVFVKRDAPLRSAPPDSPPLRSHLTREAARLVIGADPIPVSIKLNDLPPVKLTVPILLDDDDEDDEPAPSAPVGEADADVLISAAELVEAYVQHAFGSLPSCERLRVAEQTRAIANRLREAAGERAVPVAPSTEKPWKCATCEDRFHEVTTVGGYDYCSGCLLEVQEQRDKLIVRVRVLEGEGTKLRESCAALRVEREEIEEIYFREPPWGVVRRMKRERDEARARVAELEGAIRGWIKNNDCVVEYFHSADEHLRRIGREIAFGEPYLCKSPAPSQEERSDG